MQCRVVKVGGSLLEEPTLPDKLTAWLQHQRASANLVVGGGGALADGVRQLDQRHRIPPALAHRQAIRAMSVSGLILQQLMPAWGFLRCLEDWPRAGKMDATTDTWLFAVEPFLQAKEPHLPGNRLPTGWHVTSDSIAARVAEVVGAEELVLLKSSLPEPSAESIDLRAAVAAKLVDDHFPVSATTSRIRAVDLRDPAFPEIRLV